MPSSANTATAAPSLSAPSSAAFLAGSATATPVASAGGTNGKTKSRRAHLTKKEKAALQRGTALSCGCGFLWVRYSCQTHSRFGCNAMNSSDIDVFALPSAVRNGHGVCSPHSQSP